MLCLKWISSYQRVAVNKRSMCRCSTNSAPLCGKTAIQQTMPGNWSLHQLDWLRPLL